MKYITTNGFWKGIKRERMKEIKNPLNLTFW